MKRSSIKKFFVLLTLSECITSNEKKKNITKTKIYVRQMTLFAMIIVTQKKKMKRKQHKNETTWTRRAMNEFNGIFGAVYNVCNGNRLIEEMCF